MNYQIIQGDNRAVLKQFADNTFDSIVTDPPYGIDFLGRAWDATTGAVETYQECLRVLKPGGHILAFSAARTYHHLAVTLEQAGFEIRDQIMWIYSSGFPKSQDVGGSIRRSKHLDKTQAEQWSGWGTCLKPAHEPICLARKPIRLSIAGNCQQWGTGALNIDATRVPYANEADKMSIDHKVPTAAWSGHTIQVDSYEKGKFVKVETNDLGRFPSNVLGEIAEPYQKYFYCPKVSRRERHVGTDNNHPTVKPIELMKYLIKLVTPPGGRVLDPFNGSGSTGCAAVELDYDYTGIELDPAYVEIARRRIESWYRATHATTFAELFETC